MVSMYLRRLASVTPVCALILSTSAARGQQADAVTLFNNVRVFDGKSTSLSADSNVLIRGNLIERISRRRSRSIAARPPGSSTAAAGR